ncbi:MAG: PEP-CTERM sorting domain-containing protein [Gemmatimonadaceae bacterium]|jgi:hypothetical protein|nr:PEP-CTERM sorting domain-containing protein [Gemmatimonadaceae bacterium]
MKGKLAVVVAAMAVAGAAQAQTVNFNPGATVNSPALTGFQTSGAQMVGMRVTATFADASIFQDNWRDLGGGNHGAQVAGRFRLSMGSTDDSFTSNWTVASLTTGGPGLRSLRIEGREGRTLFDTCWPVRTDCANNNDTGTDGSALGWTFSSTGGTYGGTVTALYTNIVSVGGNPPVGDLFEELNMRFNADLGLVAGQTYTFRADTDNSRFDAPPPQIVPEPSTYALMATGLAGLAAISRRRRSVVKA